jgi:hypothetical protein
MHNALTINLAKKINELHISFENNAKLAISDAIEIGSLLAHAKKEGEKEDFDLWLKEKITFSVPTVNRYISLFRNQNYISDAKNVSEAYKMIETLEAQKKQTETAKAYQRVAEYRKTGIKPENWRRGTDDKIAKEEAARDERIEAVKRIADEKKAAVDEKKRDEEQRQHQMETDTENLMSFLDQTAKVARKRSEFKEKIRLSAGGMEDPFQDALMDYLEGLDDDSRRIEACHNIIKICKGIANELQVKVPDVESIGGK